MQKLCNAIVGKPVFYFNKIIFFEVPQGSSGFKVLMKTTKFCGFMKLK